MMEEYKAVAGEDGQTHVLSPDLFATAQSLVWNDTDHFLSQHRVSYVCIYAPEMPKQNATEQKKSHAHEAGLLPGKRTALSQPLAAGGCPSPPPAGTGWWQCLARLLMGFPIAY